MPIVPQLGKNPKNTSVLLNTTFFMFPKPSKNFARKSHLTNTEVYLLQIIFELVIKSLQYLSNEMGFSEHTTSLEITQSPMSFSIWKTS